MDLLKFEVFESEAKKYKFVFFFKILNYLGSISAKDLCCQEDLAMLDKSEILGYIWQFLIISSTREQFVGFYGPTEIKFHEYINKTKAFRFILQIRGQSFDLWKYT